MQLFYSGAGDFKAYQPQSSKSLGGYISSSPVLNAQVGALFSSLTRDIASHSECKMIVLDNNLTSDVSNIQIWLETTSPYITYTIDAVLPATDGKGKPIFEKISQPTQIPYQANLQVHNQSNPIDAGNLQKCKLIGIWIRRELTVDGSNFLEKLLTGQTLSCDELEQAYNDNEQIPNEIIDDASLKISFDIVNPSTTTSTTIPGTTTTTTIAPQVYSLPMFETIENQTDYSIPALQNAELISVIVDINPMQIVVLSDSQSAQDLQPGQVSLRGTTFMIPPQYGGELKVFIIYKK